MRTEVKARDTSVFFDVHGRKRRAIGRIGHAGEVLYDYTTKHGQEERGGKTGK